MLAPQLRWRLAGGASSRRGIRREVRSAAGASCHRAHCAARGAVPRGPRGAPGGARPARRGCHARRARRPRSGGSQRARRGGRNAHLRGRELLGRARAHLPGLLRGPDGAGGRPAQHLGRPRILSREVLGCKSCGPVAGVRVCRATLRGPLRVRIQLACARARRGFEESEPGVPERDSGPHNAGRHRAPSPIAHRPSPIAGRPSPHAQQPGRVAAAGHRHSRVAAGTSYNTGRSRFFRAHASHPLPRALHPQTSRKGGSGMS